MTEPEPEKIEVTAADVITEKVEKTAEMQCEEEIPKSEEFMNEPEILGELKVTEPQKEEAQKQLITVTMEEDKEEEDWEDDKTELPKVGDLIYLSGPVTGTNDYPDRFEKAEKTMCDLGYTPINPIACVRLPECCTHEEWMKVEIALLGICKGIFLMRGWENSEGCREEFEAAKKNGKCVMIEAAPGIWHKASEVE